MKCMSPQGKYCDLACYPICPGYFREGCLMFNEERSFFTMKMMLLAQGTDVREMPAHAGGMWLKNFGIQMTKNVKPNIYIDEQIH